MAKKFNVSGIAVLVGLAGAAYYVSGHGFTLPNLTMLTNPTYSTDTLHAIDAAKTQLAASIGGSIDGISLVSAQAAQWSDNSLGCHLPGYVYNVSEPATHTTGWKILLQTPGGRQYDYRVRSDFLVVELCPYG